MKYADHIPFYDREIDALWKQPIGLSFQLIHEVLGGAENPEADEACRVFAATLQWPPMSDRTRLEIGLRLIVARDWCRGAAEEEVPSGEGAEELMSGLIDYWQDDGRRHWLWEQFVELKED